MRLRRKETKFPSALPARVGLEASGDVRKDFEGRKLLSAGESEPV